MLSLEFSWGRWNGDDLRSLEESTVTLITRVATLLNFDRLVDAARPAGGDPASTSSTSDVHTTASTVTDSRWHETALLRSIHTRNAALEEAHGVRPADIFPLLDSVTYDLRAASTAALAALRAHIAHVNRTRWRGASTSPSTALALDEAQAHLRAALADFGAVRRGGLIAPFLPLLEASLADGKTRDQPISLPLRSLYVAYVFAANMSAIAEAVVGLLGAVQEIEAKRPQKARLWAPTGMRSVWKLVTARGDNVDGAFGEDTSPPVVDMMVHEEEKVYRALFIPLMRAAVKFEQGRTRTAVLRQIWCRGL